MVLLTSPWARVYAIGIFDAIPTFGAPRPGRNRMAKAGKAKGPVNPGSLLILTAQLRQAITSRVMKSRLP